jgi:hypothetical protein
MGQKYANPRRREDRGIKTSGKWTLVSGVNGGASLKLVKVFGRIESGLSIYVTKSPVCLIPNIMNDSPLWKDMMKIMHIYLKGREYHITNDWSISFRMDTWLGDKPLCVQYPVLFDLYVEKNCSVQNVVVAEWVVRFRIQLQGLVREQWYDLAARLNTISLTNEKRT